MTGSRLQHIQNEKSTRPALPQRDEAARSTTRSTAHTLAAPQSLSPATMKTLQRSYGNRAVSNLIQTKLTVGPVGDAYEQEADRIAKRVVNMQTQTPTAEQPAQRQAEEEELQAKPLADTITPIAQRQPEEEELQMHRLQRQEDEEELQMSRQGASAAGGPVSDDLEDAVQRAKGGGRPLAEGLRAKMEAGFGTDFSGVRVHDDSRSDALNRSLSARAFTTGQDVFFKQGEYEPESSDGQELIAHELTHVVQQTGAK